MAWDIIKIVLIVLGAPVALVLALLLVLTFTSCFNVRLRFSNFEETLLTVRYGLLRFKILPKKAKPEPTEEEKQRAEEKKKKKAARRARRREKYEKWKMRRAVRKERRKARKAARLARKGKKPKFSREADWLAEPTEGKTRAIFETVFDRLPKLARLLKFDKIRLDMAVRGENPAETGIKYGRVGAIFGIAYPRIMSIFDVGQHNVNVNADFANRGKTETKLDITVCLRPIKIVGQLIGFLVSWNGNKDRYCVKPKTSHTTVKMKTDGGNKHE